MTLPHALLQQPIGVLVSALQTNALGSHPAEGFDLVQFENLPRLDYELFYVREELRRAGVREDLSSLLVHLVEQRYLNGRTNIANSGALADSGDVLETSTGSREVIEQFLKFDHVNIQALGRILRRVRARIDSEFKGLWGLIERLACVDSATLGRSGLLGKVVSALATVQMLRDDARELEFKVAQEYCRLVIQAQKKRVEGEKKKKLRVQRQAEFAREDTALIRQVVLALHPETARAHAAYFDGILAEMSGFVEAAKKTKVKAPPPRSADFLAELGGVGGIDQGQVQQVPELVPVSPVYVLDMIANPPRPPEPNKWRLQEQTLRGPDATARGHNADAFDEACVEEQLRAEEDLGVELRTFDGRVLDEREKKLVRDPVRYQIARLKELQRQRALGTLKPQSGVESGFRSGYGVGRSGAHATLAQPELVMANARFFCPLSLRRRLEWVRGARDRTGEAPGREFSEVGGDVREFDGASDGHLVQKQF